jgi:hypothetical protein
MSVQDIVMQQISFRAPTLWGVLLRELFLCEKYIIAMVKSLKSVG